MYQFLIGNVKQNIMMNLVVIEGRITYQFLIGNVKRNEQMQFRQLKSNGINSL